MSDKTTLQALRDKLAGKQPGGYWRSLEELAGSEELARYADDEFPHRESLVNGMDRRSFVKLMGASVALAGLAGCRRLPADHIVPYVRHPEEIVPGKALYYASSFVLGGYALGVLVESHEGRPTKIEGNPIHPASLGSTEVFSQASILNLYDPDRAQAIKQFGTTRSMAQMMSALRGALARQMDKKGAGLRILTETVSSPTLARLIDNFLVEYPEGRWIQYDPVNEDNLWVGMKAAYGRYVQPVYDFTKPKVILSVDCDFMVELPGSVRYSRDFSAQRQIRDDKHDMPRLYALKSAPNVTASLADHKLTVKPSEAEAIVWSVAAAMGMSVNAPSTEHQGWASAVASDLRAAGAEALVIAGPRCSPQTQTLVMQMNEALGAMGNTVRLVEPVLPKVEEQTASMMALAQEMRAGTVDCLIMLGGNPAYNAPADAEFAQSLETISKKDGAFTLRLGMHDDETAGISQWVAPDAHYLESWSDAVAFDGTVSLVQPLIEPLYSAVSPLDLFCAIEGKGRTAYDAVKDYWKAAMPRADFDKFWRKCVHDGMIAGTSAKVASVSASGGAQPPKLNQGMELILAADPTVYDGRYANNGWLQELSKPVTSLCWDNACLLGVRKAQELGIENQTMVNLKVGERSVKAAAFVVPGHPNEAVTLHLGYGRRRGGEVAVGYGFDAYAVRNSDHPWAAPVEVEKIGGEYLLAFTTNHNVIWHGQKGEDTQFGRDIIRTHDLHGEHDDSGHHGHHGELRSMYPEREWDGYKWAMVIDTNLCNGCNACVMACQAENNINIVGKDEVRRHREMQWIRIDRYYQGDVDNPETYHVPLPCMHCEQAPCEPVCPVAATVHSAEGLNQMVYNRCVGTRYCSNNCPYKVRRFNYFKYGYLKDKYDLELPVLKLMRNPNVTVCGRGVMEKCTYCVQRINAGRIEAKKANRRLKDHEVVTACQQACPTKAIEFGDMADPESAVSKLRAQEQHYSLLEDLGTKPRTTYLGRYRNNNTELEKA